MKTLYCLVLGASALCLSACGSVPFGGGVGQMSIAAGGLNWNAGSGATAGYTQAKAVWDPDVIKDAKGNAVSMMTPKGCGRVGPPDIVSIMSGNATANATAASPTGTPSIQSSLAINEGLFVGDAAILDRLAQLQIAAGSMHDELLSYNTCASQPTSIR